MKPNSSLIYEPLTAAKKDYFLNKVIFNVSGAYFTLSCENFAKKILTSYLTINFIKFVTKYHKMTSIKKQIRSVFIIYIF